MKPNEFKKILKPLIKEAVKEVILEEGILSKIVSEVARGMGSSMLAESKTPKPPPPPPRGKEDLMEQQRQERIRRLNESVGFDNNVFEGVKNIPQESPDHGALSGVASADAGVDIAGIMDISNGKWKALAGN